MSSACDRPTVTTLAEAPELEPTLWSLTSVWPAFMLEDPIADLYFSDFARVHAEYVLVAVCPDDPARGIARAFSVPFALGAEVRRPELPADGWDGVVRWAWLDRLHGRAPTHVSALDITIAADHQGRGLSALMLTAMRDNARRLGHSTLVAPVRPTGKSREPHLPMADYARRTRPDGLPADPWLRTHVRVGGRILQVCPRSMVVPGTLAEWRKWTGCPSTPPARSWCPALSRPCTAASSRTMPSTSSPTCGWSTISGSPRDGGVCGPA